MIRRNNANLTSGITLLHIHTCCDSSNLLKGVKHKIHMILTNLGENTHKKLKSSMLHAC